MRPVGFLFRRLALLPWPWFAGAGFMALLAWTWLSGIDAYQSAQTTTGRMSVTLGDALVAPLMARCAIALAVFACLLSASGWVRDQGRMGEWLLVSPRPALPLALGYWLTQLCTLAIMLLLVVAMAVTTALGGAIDPGAVASAAIGLALLAGFVAALSALASALSVSAVMAIALSAFAVICLWAPDSAALARGTRSVALESIAISHRISGFLRGQVALDDIAYFLGGIGAFVLGTAAWLAERRRWWLMAAAIWCFVCGTVVVALDARQVQWDWSADARYTLPVETRDLLRSIEAPVAVQVVGAGPAQQRSIEEFFAPFEASGNWHLRFSDHIPGIGRPPGVTIELNDRSESLNNLSRRDVHAIIARLSDQQRWSVGYVTGQGERSLGGTRNFDLGEWGREMELRNVRLLPIDVVMQPVIPESLDLLVVPTMAREPAPGTLEAIHAYVRNGGQALWLLDPGIHRSFMDALMTSGVEILPGQVVDARYSDHGASDPNQLILRRFPEHVVNAEFTSPILLPAAVALTGETALLLSTNTSWNETGALIGALTIDGDEEVRGPLAVAVLQPEGQGRHAVVGDSDFLSNQFVGNGGNLQWGMRLVFHLLEAGPVSAQPVEATAYRLEFDGAMLGMVGLLWLVLVPAGLALVGVARWRRLYRA